MYAVLSFLLLAFAYFNALNRMSGGTRLFTAVVEHASRSNMEQACLVEPLATRSHVNVLFVVVWVEPLATLRCQTLRTRVIVRDDSLVLDIMGCALFLISPSWLLCLCSLSLP